MRVGLGEGVAAEAALPFGLVSQALGGLGGFDGLRAVDGLASADARAALYYRTVRWLEQTAATAPLLVLLDDLHWADPDSLALVEFLSRRMAGWGVAVVATTRPWPGAALGVAEALVAQGRARIEQLRSLSLEAAASVLTEAAGRDLTELEQVEAVEGCGGNPLLLTQSGVALRSRPAGTAAWSGSDARLLVARFGGLPAEVLRVARVAAVFGTRFRVHLVAVAAELDEVQAERAVTPRHRPS